MEPDLQVLSDGFAEAQPRMDVARDTLPASLRVAQRTAATNHCALVVSDDGRRRVAATRCIACRGWQLKAVSSWDRAIERGLESATAVIMDADALRLPGAEHALIDVAPPEALMLVLRPVDAVPRWLPPQARATSLKEALETLAQVGQSVHPVRARRGLSR